MVQLKYNNEVFKMSSSQSVLETLLENGHEIPNNCRAGACQSCIMQLTKGNVPTQAQKGLKDSHKAIGLFLACRCQPEDDIDIRLPNTEQLRSPAKVSHITKLSHDVIELKIRTTEPFAYHAGQYAILWRDTQTGRSYSIASLFQSDEDLTFHIKLIPEGAFSSWAHHDLQTGDAISIQGPIGDCFYTPGKAEQNLLLIGTGTGLAPLYGILRDALDNGHTGEIHLFHGALNVSGLYLHDTLTAYAREQTHFHYHPCVINAEEGMPETITIGDISQIALNVVPKPKGWKTFLCGDQDIVKKLRKQIFLAGCNMNDIYADPFIHVQ